MDNLSSSSTLAKDLMNSKAVPLKPGKFDKNLALQFLSGQYSGWPVVDFTNKILGVVTELCLLQAISRLKSLDDLRVEDTMTAPVYVFEHDPLDVVLNVMVQKQVLKLPVVYDGNLVGVISRGHVIGHCLPVSSSSSRFISSCAWCDRVSDFSQETKEAFQPFSTTSQNPLPHDGEGKRDRPCLLVVDDDPSVAKMLSEALQEWGYHVVIARNGREGLDLVERRAVHGILLDMHMPVMDGRTMLDELRWLGYHMPVLMMSGGSDERALRQLLKEGAQGFFLKPFHLTSLQQACRKVFHTYETKRIKKSASSHSHVA